MNTQHTARRGGRSRRRVLMTPAVLVAVLATSAAPQLSATAGTSVTAVRPAVASEPWTAEPSSASARRPATGYVVSRTGGSGPGEFVVENGTTSDAVATLSRRGKAVRAVYVRGGGTARVRDVPDGTYDIYYTLGSRWDDRARAFSLNPTYRRFDTSAGFTTKRTRTTTRYSRFTITLHPVAGGTATTSPVPRGAFPQ